jgi:sugar-specific transcriptional regulator TrmB
LKLISLGKTDGKTLSKQANIPRPVVYRTLEELQKKGLVERELAVPYKYTATPLKEGLQIIASQKLEQYVEERDKIQEFLLKNQHIEQVSPDEPKLSVFEGKGRIIRKMQNQHDVAQQSVVILSTFQRWVSIIDCCLENYKKALGRKVEYRIIVAVEKDSEIDLPENVHVLLGYPNFKIKFTCEPLVNNLAIFDGREATFTFFPSKALGHSPLILTNHSGFITMAQDHFERIWSKIG